MIQTYKQYLEELFIEDPAIVNQAKRTFQKQKQASLEKQKQLMKASRAKGATGQAAKERLKLLKQLYTKLNDPNSDEDIASTAGLESTIINTNMLDNDTFLDYLNYIEESSNFIKSLMDKNGITKTKAEKAWNIATKSFKTGKFKNVKGDRKYKLIAGLAKKIALQEDGISGEPSMGVPLVAGSAINTTNIGGTFAPKLGEEPNIDKLYKANSANIFTRYSSYSKKKKKKRKYKKESVDVDNFVDKLFE